MNNMQKLIILAAGHGGTDNGAVGQGTTEAQEVIDITNRCVDLLRKDGQLQVVQVPNELDFIEGIDWVNKRYTTLDEGLAVEVHKNSATVPAHGAETWYYADDTNSQTIAQKIQDKLKEILTDRGVKPDTSDRFGRLGWIRDVNTWSVLVEVGFVSDGGDPVGADANARYAEALARGILNVWGLTLHKEDDMLSEEGAKDAYRATLHREPESEQAWRPMVGRRFEDIATEIMTSKEWLTQNHYVLVYPSLVEQLTAKIQALQATPTAKQVADLQAEAKALQVTVDSLPGVK